MSMNGTLVSEETQTNNQSRSYRSWRVAWAVRRATLQSLASPHWRGCWRCWCSRHRAAGRWSACTAAGGPSTLVSGDTCRAGATRSPTHWQLRCGTRSDSMLVCMYMFLFVCLLLLFVLSNKLIHQLSESGQRATALSLCKEPSRKCVKMNGCQWMESMLQPLASKLHRSLIKTSTYSQKQGVERGCATSNMSTHPKCTAIRRFCDIKKES